MNYFIQQTIQINSIKIEAISNSAVFQIGSAGIIKGSSHLHNTGGFIAPAPIPQKPGEDTVFVETGGDLSDSYLTMPSVPLVGP